MLVVIYLNWGNLYVLKACAKKTEIALFKTTALIIAKCCERKN